LFEALCCVKYHQDDEKLAQYFDYVFQQAQNKKILRMGEVVPAMTRFLFSNDPIRYRFAKTGWLKAKTGLTPATFEWVVHDVLEQNIMLVANVHPDSEDTFRFWQGFLSIVEAMDENLIRNCLRAMEVQPDIYRLALQHLASSSESTVDLIITCLRKLLIKAPKDFWAAMGNISPATVVDQIFQSPGYAKMLNNPASWSVFEHSSVVSWIPILLNSLDPAHRYDACRKLVEGLLVNISGNSKKFSSQAIQGCCRAGLEALHVTLQTFITTDYRINPSTSMIFISKVMELVCHYKTAIMGCADFDAQLELDERAEVKEAAMLVIKDALALDCKAIAAEVHALDTGKMLQRGGRSNSQDIWQAVLEIFRPGNLTLVKSILPALGHLTGVDVLRPMDRHHPERLPEDHAGFNKDLRELFDNIAKVLERLSDFSSQDLSKLMQDNASARSLIACLISADQGISEAAVEIFKVMTAQESKRDAFEHLLSSHLGQTLSYMVSAIKRVSNSRTFGPMPYLIKNGRDMLGSLCGATGVLRSRSEFQQEEKSALLGWWTTIWQALDVVFSCTEDWATRVDRNTAYMQDFLRDCMEFAESLFDNHSIVASVLRESNISDSNSEKAGNKKVLEVVCRNINGLVRMIRLKDVYLVSVIASLLGKLLRCLGEYDITVDDTSSRYIRGSYKRESDKGYVRTNLTLQQRAELQRALDENVGIDFVEISKPIVVKKQATIDAWSQSAEGRQHEPKLPPKRTLPFARSVDKPAEKLDNKTVDRLKGLLKAREAVTTQQQDQFKEKRRRDAAEAKRLKEEAIAKARALRGPAAIIKGEGSGLKDIGGVAGKDHAPARSEIMVGSSDEDSDDDDDEDETNALVKKRKETSKMVSEYEESKRRAFKLAQEGPVKKVKIVRSKKDQRARVDPDMTKLFLEVLNWDIFHPGDAPPSNNQCRKIDNMYQDLDLYKRTFGPLLISEVWRSIVTAKDENSYRAVEIKVLNRVNVDKFLEISTSMPLADNKDLWLSERDIVLFSKASDPLNNPQAPHCLARVDRTTKKKDALEITYRISRDVSPDFLTSFVPNGKVFALKICDLTTTQREFAALSSLEYYDLCMEVLEAKPSPLLNYSEEKISNISSRYNLNRGQAKAILSANDNDGFTLIQGPPGSGKTKTIVAMVGALLTPILQQQQADQARVRPPTTGKIVPPPGPKKKLLICAPSNAAVDELVARLMEGIQPLTGPRQKINVIRIGRSEAINTAVKDVILDELVRAKLEGDSDKNKVLEARNSLHKEAGAVKERLNVIRPQIDEAQKEAKIDKLLSLRKEFDQLKRRQAQLGAKIDEDNNSGMTFSRQNEISRRKFQQEIIDGAHVICATLSGSGHDMFKNLEVDFETVIIDEAAQCIELSALIPLKYGCSKCILVGDPEQLPPTVLSRSAQSFGYEQSLFVRMQKNHPKNIHLLDTQYRMHPEISRFPSAQFYNSRLVDGEGMAALRQQPWHASKILGPYRFFDVKGVQTKQALGHSFINVPELDAALQLYQRLKSDYSQVDFKGKIGIITSYKAQLNELKARFARRYTDAIFEEIEFNTTDAFQGREREIIIFSCVRAKATGGIGFLGDIRRMNVGLTRAKSSLWVLGDSRALQQGKFWNELIKDAQARGRYTSDNVMELFGRPTERLQGPVEPEAPLLPIRTMSVSSATGKTEDGDVVMTNAPGFSESRKSSVSSSSETKISSVPKTRNLLGISNAKRPVVQHDSRSSSVGASSSASNEVNAFGKRPHETSDEIPAPEQVNISPMLQLNRDKVLIIDSVFIRKIRRLISMLLSEHNKLPKPQSSHVLPAHQE
jgi:senataxin